jgi:hypothetical protein
MARTISEIYNSIIAEKNTMSQLVAMLPNTDDAQTLLTNLTSTSKVAVWRLWAWLISVAIWTHEMLWDAFKSEIDAIVDAAIPGTAKWYREQVLAYQHGDELETIGNKIQYAGIIEAAQIIKQCSVEEYGGQLKIKVAKADNVPLATLELGGLTDYLAEVKFAGTALLIISDAADKLRLNVSVYVNTTLISIEGVSLATPGTYPVVDAIKAFIASLPWDGTVYLSKLTDAIQAVPGVTDVTINQATASKNSPVSFSAIVRKYQTYAGHIIFDDANSNITYSSDV